MTIRFDDARRTLELSVGDLVALGARGAHLVVGAGAGAGRLRLGQWVHDEERRQRSEIDERFVAEVRVERQLVVRDWTVTVAGRVDGLTEEGGVPVVEEVKSVGLGADTLLGTDLSHWPDYARQLDLYLWALVRPGSVPPIGRLILISVVDGARHVLGAGLDVAAVDASVRGVLSERIDDHERRRAWLAARRRAPIADPFPTPRPGQTALYDAVTSSLERGRSILVEAPTGLGKTAPLLTAALRFARQHDKIVFWATHRTTQQRAPLDVVRRIRGAGTPVRAVLLSARERVCTNDVVSCRPDACRFADGYHDRVRDHREPARLAEDPETLRAIARAAVLCPHELALDASSEVDLIVGDVNLALEPGVRVARLFDPDVADRIVLVVDEAHQLADRARSWGSPRVRRVAVDQAEAHLVRLFGADARPWVDLCRDVRDAIDDAAHQIDGPVRDGVGVADLSRRVWRDLADRVLDGALDHARLDAARPRDDEPSADPWRDVSRSLVRLADGLDVDDDGATVSLVGFGADAFVGRLCLDPAPSLGPRLAALGGVVLSSATLSPPEHHARQVGLVAPDRVSVPSFFPPERRKVLIAPRVSTAFKDRVAHAAPTAKVIAECLDAAPGNVAVFFSSFAMLTDLADRIEPGRREFVRQTPTMSEEDRAATLRRLSTPGPPVVLFAVLGGIFAEGVDLPPGALDAVVIVGPGLPPVGLEQDLLRAYLERHHDDGFVLATLVPGITRVVQAAGRLIRRAEDRGAIVLVDRRFRWRDTLALLPDDWSPEIVNHPGPTLKAFFDGVDGVPA